MNHELIVHGWSNLLSGVFGGLQNYLCYSNSVLYYKCNGGGKVCGFFLTCATTLFFVIGPSAVQYIPRCMAGCLLIYLGIDLMKEALLDSYSLFDQIEYCSVLIITVVMTSAGMTAGLGMGVILSAVAFTLQMFKHSEPIRGAMPASTLKSSRLRSPREQKHLEANLDRVTVVQVQGTLFFGNATVLSLQVDELLQGMHQGMRQGGCALYHQGDLGDEELGGSGGKRVSGMMIQRRPMRRVTIVLDFTLVRSIDSSASDTVAKIAFVAQKHRASIVFVRGSSDGFPCQAPLSDQLTQASERKQTTNTHDDEGTFKVLHVVNSLDEALEWCEDCLLADAGLDVGTRSRNTSACSRLPCDPAQEFNTVAKLIHQLCPEIDVGTEKGQEPSLTLDVAKELLKFFKRREMKAGEVLWHQSESSTFMVLVFRGKLLSVLEHEAGTSELVHPGSLIGDFGLLNRVSRTSTVTCSEDRTVVYVLNLHEWELILEQHCNLAYMLFQICIRYLGRRCNHVSNRVWESHCLPI
uniref:Cyclic nucleotide-binding domain-containing protein n=1 Tax=Octactis speculum TaxID=3111310 RepID=A0A7S2CMB3_9STRA